MGREAEPNLVCRVGNCVCALPVGTLVETMRPLPIEPLAGAPPFVLGVSIIRGEPVPVIDAGSLVGEGRQVAPARFVTLKVGARHVALAVDAVLGIRELARGAVDALPPLLEGASSDAIAAIGSLDADLLLALRTGRLVPDEVWNALDRVGT